MTGDASTHDALGTSGEIRHWLRSGPATAFLPNLRDVIRPDGSPFGPEGRWAISNAPDSLGLKARVDRWLPPEDWRPGGRPALGEDGPVAGTRWDYAATGEDQVVDFSLFNFSPARMDAWMYAGLVAEDAQQAAGDLLTVGPAQVWVNGLRMLHHAGFEYAQPAAVALILPLLAGWNDLWLHGRMIGWREARLALGVRVRAPGRVMTALPLGGVPVSRWRQAAEDMSRVSVRQFAFPERAVRIWLDRTAPAPLDILAEVVASPPHVTFPGVRGTPRTALPMVSTHLRVNPGETASLSCRASGDDRADLPFERGWRLRLSPADGTPFSVEREIWLGREASRVPPAFAGDSYDARRQEAVAHAAGMPTQVLGALAAVERGNARVIEPDAVTLACDFLEHRCDCADFYAVDLLTLLYRVAGHSALRPADHRRIEAALRGFKFWIDEPGVDGVCYHTENHQILFHVAAYLAGQRWPDVVFDNSGWTGRAQMRRAKLRIREWILRRLRGGFSEWDSNTYLALDAYAMLALAEFAASHSLGQLATALLHKIFFILACQSWRGAHGSSHGRTYVASLKTARVENTSGLQRIAWGLGGFGPEVRATGLLAMARRYRVPDVLQRIGADLPELLVTHARSAGRFRAQFDLRRERWEVSTLTRRTPDYMLAAALDHRPGAVGIQEHLWQATLGPEAVVFTTHPGNSQEHENARPNFWAGSARLPRVTMVDDAVICVYDPALPGGLRFTHAYFPAEAFDEHVLDGPWAFARVRNGYVGLWGDGTLQLTAAGPHAAQELRSDGPGRVWACRAARAATDGDFAQFCRTTRALSPRVIDGRVRWDTPTEHTLEVAWEGPLAVDGRPFDPRTFPHYDNLYTHTPMDAQTMRIAAAGEELHLDLVNGWARSSR